jgi:protoporphyrinogen oxidase
MKHQESRHLSILGGGPAGLATAFYARRHGLPSTVYEASDRAGGHCATTVHDGFRFDLGAHRFHDRNPAITADVKALMGDALMPIDIPSKIYDAKMFLDFPLSTGSLLRAFGVTRLARAGMDILSQRVTRPGQPLTTFEQFANYRYGRDIARRFVLSYSEKLWGVPCDQLSPQVSGNRLKGLTLSSLLAELVAGSSARSTHLDGSFLYPAHGYGSITDCLAADCGPGGIVCESRISAINHEAGRVVSVEVNDSTTVAVDRVVSTLPLPYLLRILRPAPPEAVLQTAARFAFRDLILVALLVKRHSLTTAGSLYFPDPSVPFTRISEPRNRSAAMAPGGHTSLLVEVPISRGDAFSALCDSAVIDAVREAVARVGLVAREDIMAAHVVRTNNAYPVLTVGIEHVVRRVLDYLGRFSNLSLIGRNATFEYLHLHEIMSRAKTLASVCATSR